MIRRSGTVGTRPRVATVPRGVQRLLHGLVLTKFTRPKLHLAQEKQTHLKTIQNGWLSAVQTHGESLTVPSPLALLYPRVFTITRQCGLRAPVFQPVQGTHGPLHEGVNVHRSYRRSICHPRRPSTVAVSGNREESFFSKASSTTL